MGQESSGIGSYLKGGTVKLVVNETYNLTVVGSNATAVANVNLGTYPAGTPNIQ